MQKLQVVAEATGGAARVIISNIIVLRKWNTQVLRAESDNVERCKNARADALQVCSEFYSTCK